MSRIKVDRITDRNGTGDPLFPNGISVVGLTSLSNVIAGVATFSNVSIGGTLTYEDVTNIDSTGIVTARSGIKVTAGGVDVTAGGVNVTAGGVTVTDGGINVVAGGIDVGNGNIDSVGEISLDTIKADGGVNLAINCGTDKNVRFAGNIGEIGSVTGFQATNDSQSALTDFGIRATSIRLATSGGERLRIGDAGQIGIAGANYGTDGQVLTSKGGSAAVQWADAGGGAWEVIATHALSNGQSANIDNTGWSDAYQLYRVIITGVNNGSGGMALWVRWYMSDNPSSTAAGTLQTSDKYHYFKSQLGSTSNTNVEDDYWKLYSNSTRTVWDHVQLDFPMTSYTGNYKKGSIAKYSFFETGIFQERAYWDHNTQEDYHIKGCRIHFPSGTSDLQGRVTFLRFKHA